MPDLSEIYNRLYLQDYRKILEGYEKARWKAIMHLRGVVG